MKITSWNVNGIRAVLNKWFLEWVQQDNADIICLQETKAFEFQLPPEVKFALKDYDYVWHSWTRPWYAGTATFFKHQCHLKKNSFENPSFHEDWRIVETHFEKFVLLNIYFPNGWDRADGTEMLTYKLNFYNEVIAYCNTLKALGKEVILCGDFNIVHTAIDIARPKENENSIWFLPIEREHVSKLIDSGFTDVFRYVYPDTLHKYTWWSYRAWARPRNVGWRIDYFFVSPGLVPHIKAFYHQDEVMGSDHCPVTLELDL